MQFRRLSKFLLPPTEDLPGPAHIPPQAAATSASRPLLQRLESIETISHATHPYRRSPGGGLAQENLQPQIQHSPMQLTEHSSQRSDPKRRAVCATSSWPFRFAGVLLPAFILALFLCVFFFLATYACKSRWEERSDLLMVRPRLKSGFALNPGWLWLDEPCWWAQPSARRAAPGSALTRWGCWSSGSSPSRFCPCPHAAPLITAHPNTLGLLSLSS